MSKLRDRIRDTATPRREPIGFTRTAPAAGSSHVLVIAEVTDAAGARTAVEAGADALLHTGDTDALAAVVQAAGTTPAGCRLEDASPDSAAAAVEAGADFFLFDAARSDARSLLQRDVGHVLLLDGSPDEDGLRALSPLDLDAILVPPPPAAMTVRDQLSLRRVADLVRAPLIVPLSAAVGASALEVWRDSGAPAVLLASAAAEALPAILEAARAVPPPRERTRDPSMTLLPTVLPVAADDDDMPPDPEPFPETPVNLT